ncbi:MAG: hypothetical protein WCJ55_10045 [Chloroflexales bacterium]
MAQTVTIQAQIDHELNYLIASWEDLEEILTFDSNSRFDYAVDWPLKTMAEERLHSLIAQHGLTPAQQERYDYLRAIQTQNAPLLAQLLAS